MIQSIKEFPSEQAEEIQKELNKLEEEGKLREYFLNNLKGLKIVDNSLANFCLDRWETLGSIIYREYTGIEVDKADKETVISTGVKINEIAKYSGKQLLWKCHLCENEWVAALSTRTFGYHNCPACNSYGTSFPEQYIYQGLKELGLNVVNRAKMFKSQVNNGIEYDIFIDEAFDKYKGVLIEYNSIWHDGKEEYDTFKKKTAEENNYKFIEIYEFDKETKYRGIVEDEYIETYVGQYNKDDCLRLKEIVKNIANLYNKAEKLKELNYGKVYHEAYNKSHSIIDIEESLSYYEGLCKEIDKDIHKNIDTSKIKQGSNLVLNWKCTHCNFKWKAAVISRTGQKSGCPNCHYNWFKDITGENQLIRDLSTINNLTEFDYLWKEYDKEKNKDVDISKLTKACHTKVWWKCPHCKKSWKAVVKNRAMNKTGCPECGFNWYRDKIGEAQKYKNKLDNLEDNIELMKEVKPGEDTSIKSSRISWICPYCKNEWTSRIIDRIYKRSGCPHCGFNWYRKQIGQKQILKIKLLKDEFPKLYKDIDKTKNKGINIEGLSRYTRDSIDWKCQCCKGEWNSPMRSRVYYKTKCPFCGLNPFEE